MTAAARKPLTTGSDYFAALEAVLNEWARIETAQPLALQLLLTKLAMQDDAVRRVSVEGVLVALAHCMVPLPPHIRQRRTKYFDCRPFTTYGELASAMLAILQKLQAQSREFLERVGPLKGSLLH